MKEALEFTVYRLLEDGPASTYFPARFARVLNRYSEPNNLVAKGWQQVAACEA